MERSGGRTDVRTRLKGKERLVRRRLERMTRGKELPVRRGGGPELNMGEGGCNGLRTGEEHFTREGTDVNVINEEAVFGE